VLANNLSAGILGSPASLVLLGGSTVTGNATGISTGGGTVESLQDNHVRGNATDLTGMLTLVART
jgi:hypothetical protein